MECSAEKRHVRKSPYQNQNVNFPTQTQDENLSRQFPPAEIPSQLTSQDGLSHIQHTYARDGGGGVQLIYDLREIRANYLRCWFALDLVAIMPVDYITRYITNDLECRYARRQPMSTRSYPGAAALGTGLRRPVRT